jgi:uncharacterized membrane protein
MTRSRHNFWTDFRTFFLKGLGILLPSLVTLALLLWAYNFLRTNIAEPINAAVRQGVLLATPELYANAEPDDQPNWYRVTRTELVEEAGGEEQLDELDDAERNTLRSRARANGLAEYWQERWWLQGIGFVVAIIAVYLAGVLVGNYLGKRVYLRFESWLIRVPVIKQVYPNVKQIVEFLIGDDDSKLPTSGKVVLVEYPRKGIWTVGLMTGGTLHSIQTTVGKSSVTVFIPSSPTPFTGYTITVPAEEVHELNITFDEAIRFVVSGGVLVPPRERVESPPEIVRAIKPVESAEGAASDRVIDPPTNDIADSADAPGAIAPPAGVETGEDRDRAAASSRPAASIEHDSPRDPRRRDA